MSIKKYYHSLCAWTFNSGKGGFTPAMARPQWAADKMGTVEKIGLVKEKIVPRLPETIQLGFEMHYNYEYNENDAAQIADALVDAGIALAMATPGAHQHFAYGGICSMDPDEQKKSCEYGMKSLQLAYGPLKKAWNKDVVPTFVIWNGSFGYDLTSVYIRDMYQNLKSAVMQLCRAEKELGGEMYIGLEPKPNEGHAAMLIPTVASAIAFWYKLEKEFGIDISKKGVNKEFGHSEMIGLDHVYDTVEEIDNEMLVHMHINSQGYNDGLILGGPGKFDIDNGARINGMNVAIGGLIGQANYSRWRGHDMQVRPYDSEEQGIDRVVRSVLSWHACELAAAEVDYKELHGLLSNRAVAKAEDLMRTAVTRAYKLFDEMNK